MEYELVYGLPKAEVLAQMAEELTEAAQAALKLRRAMDGANPTPISVDTGMNNLIEELADCQLCEDIFFHGMATQCVNHAYREIDRIKSEKMERWETRLESAKMRLYAVAVGTKDTIKLSRFPLSIPPRLRSWQKNCITRYTPATPIEQLEADIVERGRNW